MLENPGKKIKSVAALVFWVMAIASVVLAFVVGIEREYVPGHYAGSLYLSPYTDTHFHAGLFFSFLILGPLTAYVSALLLAGFGELVENSAKTEDQKSSDEKEKKIDQAKKDYEREAAQARKEISKLH